MSPEEYHKRRLTDPDLLLIDIRETYEYDFENLGGKNVPMGELLDRLDEIPKNKTVILHCQSGNRAKKMNEVLNFMGYSNVLHLEGNIEIFKTVVNHE